MKLLVATGETIVSLDSDSGSIFDFSDYGNPVILEALLQWFIPCSLVLPEFLKKGLARTVTGAK